MTPVVPVQPGPTNSIVDVLGIRVGQHQRAGQGWLTGTTVVAAPAQGAVGGVDVRGGGPGTRETDLLDPRNQVERVHAVVLTGGSAFGLAAADGVMQGLADVGRGFPVGGPGQVVPIVPAAVVFDLGRGGDFELRPDTAFGAAALAAALGDGGDGPPACGVAGVGTGTQAGGLKGGVGSASAVLPDGTTVAALVVVNATGSTVDPATGELYGARHLLDGDTTIGPDGATYRLGRPSADDLTAARQAAEARGDSPTLATTIGVIATDATLTKAQCAKVAGIGHDGMARAISPVHTMLDGDTLFTLATGDRDAPDLPGMHQLLDAAAGCVTRAIVRAMLAAETVSTPAGTWRSYRDTFPSAIG